MSITTLAGLALFGSLVGFMRGAREYWIALVAFVAGLLAMVQP